jgi:hypothetical protein
MASHNSKYYAKKIRKKDSKGCTNIVDMCKKWHQKNTEQHEGVSDSVCLTDETDPVANTVPVAEICQSSSLSSQSATTSSLNRDDKQDTMPSPKVIVRSESNPNIIKYERSYPWLYYSSSKGGLLCHPGGTV